MNMDAFGGLCFLLGLNQNEAYTSIAFSVDIPAKALVKNAINAL